LALDLGKKRIGLALSDPLGITAQGLPTLQRTRIREDLDALAKLAAEWDVRLLLMGHPLHMTGKEGRQAEYTREFAERLRERTGLDLLYWDERLTTVDKLSAQILLSSYLDSLPNMDSTFDEAL
jgi:putative Holliday junction resolvase